MAVYLQHLNGLSPFINSSHFLQSAEEVFINDSFDTDIIVFNNFPVSISTDTVVDLMIFVNIRNKYNTKTQFSLGEKLISNLIIPVKIISNVKSEELSEMYQDNFKDLHNYYEDEVKIIKKRVDDYLSYKCGVKINQIFPLLFFRTDLTKNIENIMLAPSLDFFTLKTYILELDQKSFTSTYDWLNRDKLYFTNALNNIFRQAANDSKFGYLTKKKLQLMSQNSYAQSRIKDHIGNELICINGNAGTGKTLDLLTTAFALVKNGQDILFLSYNKLLIFELASLFKNKVNNLLETTTGDIMLGTYAVQTFHSFFYRLCKTLRLSLVLSHDKIIESTRILEERSEKVYILILNNLNNAVTFDHKFFDRLVQESGNLTIEEKEVGLQIVNWLKFRKFQSYYSLREYVDGFKLHKKKIIQNSASKSLLLFNYDNTLQELKKLLVNDREFYNNHDIENKYDFLSAPLDIQNRDKKISYEEYSAKVKDILRKAQSNKTLFIDEAHDCSQLEKDLLVKIFGSNNIIVSSGGKEQLIRYNSVLDWSVANTKRHPYFDTKKKKTSFRMKKNLVLFSNFIAENLGLPINLESENIEDAGEIIVDLRPNFVEHLELSISKMLDKGKRYQYSEYESLMILANARSPHIRPTNQTATGTINQHGNVIDDHNNRGKWIVLPFLEAIPDIFIWNGTVDDKRKLGVPFSSDIRVIYYESCRGLEAFAVACFDIDLLFAAKRDEEKATLHMQEDMILTEEQRRNMYAGTFITMAITRAIDTLYLQVSDQNSTLGKLIMDFANQNPDKVTVLR